MQVLREREREREGEREGEREADNTKHLHPIINTSYYAVSADYLKLISPDINLVDCP